MVLYFHKIIQKNIMNWFYEKKEKDYFWTQFGAFGCIFKWKRNTHKNQCKIFLSSYGPLPLSKKLKTMHRLWENNEFLSTSLLNSVQQNIDTFVGIFWWLFFAETNSFWRFTVREVYSEPSQISMMDYFAEIVEGFQSSTIFGKNSILDVRLGSEYASGLIVCISVNSVRFHEDDLPKIIENLSTF